MDRIEIDNRIEETESVTERLALMRKAFEEADAEQDYDARIRYRLDYIHDCCFYYDTTEIYLIFPQVLRLHDEFVKEHGYDAFTAEILWDYKWLLENANEFYQISVKQFETLFEDCKRKYMENNYSPRPLYSYRFTFYLNIDKEKSMESYQNFLMQRRDWRSDCHACERAKEVQYFLKLEQFEKAAKAAAPVLDGQLDCAEQPECTIGDFLRYYNEKILAGDNDYIDPAGNLCEQLRRIIDRKGTATSYMSEILLYYAMEKPEKALAYYKKHHMYFEEVKNPINRFHFAIGAIAFLANLRGKETYKMELSPEFFMYREDDTYDVKMLTGYYMDKAREIAQKMDERNGTDAFAKHLDMAANRFLE